MRSGWCWIVVWLIAGALFGQEKSSDPPPQKFSIVVTGTFGPTPSDQVNRTVNSTVLKQTRTLFGSVYDVLQDDAAIDLRQRGPNDIQGDLSMRGGTFSQTLVLLNGMRLNDSQSAHHNLDLPIPMEAIEEVQVLHGTGSAEYGSDAVTGVVNLLAAPAAPEIRLRGALGNFGVNQQSASLAGRWRNISQQLVGARDFSSGFLANRDYRNLSLLSMTHAATRLGASDLLLSVSDRPFGADQFYGNFNSWERTKGWFAALGQQLGEKTRAEFAYRRHTDLFVLYRDRPELFTNRHAVEGWQGAVRRSQPLGTAQRLFFGVEAYADRIGSNNLGAHSRTREAGYAAYEKQWRNRYTFTAGLRDEVYGAFHHALSPTASAGFWISPKWKLRAAAGRAFRLPNYTDLYYHDPANEGSPNLRPETSVNVEGGADWRPHSRIRAGATVFRRRDTDLIDYVLTPADSIYRATNVQSLSFTGFEAAVDVRAGSAQEITVRYTGLSGSRSPLPGVISKYVFNYARHQGVISWRGSLGSMFAGRMRLRVLERFGAGRYAVWDASIARTRGSIRPFVQFTNLTNAVYVEVPGVAMPGRGVVGGIEWRIVDRN